MNYKVRETFEHINKYWKKEYYETCYYHGIGADYRSPKIGIHSTHYEECGY